MTRLVRRALSQLGQSVGERGVLRTLVLCLSLPLRPVLRMQAVQKARLEYKCRRFDRKFGVDTAGWIEPPNLGIPHPELSVLYSAIDTASFDLIFKRLAIRYEEFSFFDFGSGKGKALLLAARFPFRRVVGIELSRMLHDVAQQNIRSYKGPRRAGEIESVWMDATAFPLPPEPSIFFLNNPFRDQVMVRMVKNISESYRANPREIYVVYIAPRYGEMFASTGFLSSVFNREWCEVFHSSTPLP